MDIRDAIMRRLTKLLMGYWARRTPPTIPHRHHSDALADNVQKTMNLIMPLAHPGPATTAALLKVLRERNDDLYAGLDNVGTVHFARFDVIGDNLAMVSVYDGDFESYIRDFVASIGHVFDMALEFVADPPPRPTRDFPGAFVDWVNERDLLQMPDNSTELVDDLNLLMRETLLILRERPSVQLGSYRSYGGFSVAQIRQALELEWPKP